MIINKRLLLPVLAFGTWGLYLRTLAPTVTVDDSGDFALAAHYFGAPHPPGYPVFVLLSRLFTVIPLGDVAFRVNLLSAAAGVLAVVLLFLFVEEILSPVGASGYLPPFLAALLLAGSRTFWRLATYAEVATAMTAVVLGILLFLCRWHRLKRPRYVMIAALLAGVSMGVHYVAFIVAALFGGMGFFPWFTRSGFCHRRFLLAITLFFLGSAVFLMLPLRSIHHPDYNWGQPRSYESLKTVMSRSQYGDTSFSGGNANRRLSQLEYLFQGIVRQFGDSLPPTMILGAVSFIFLGIIFLWTINRWLSISLFAAAVVPMVVLAWVLDFNLDPLSFYYVDVFYVPAYALLFAFAGVGVGYVKKIAGCIGHRWVETVLVGLLLVYPMGSIISNSFLSSRRHSLGYYDVALSSLKTLPPGGLLLVRGDPYTFCIWYAQRILGKSPAKSVLNTTLIDLPWYRQEVGKHHPDLGRILAALPGPVTEKNSETRKSAAVLAWMERGGTVYSLFNDELPSRLWKMEPHGLIYRVLKASKSFDNTAACRAAERFWSGNRVRGLSPWKPGERLYDAELVDQVATRRYNTGTIYSAAGKYVEALRHLDEAVNLVSGRADIRINRGIVFFKLNRVQEAIEEFEAAVVCDSSLLLGWQNLIVARSIQNDKAGAEEAARRAAEALSNRPDRLANLAEILEKLGYSTPARVVKK